VLDQWLAGAAESVDPTSEDGVVGGLEVEKFDTQADAGLDDTNNDQRFECLALAGEAEARTGVGGKLFAGADETAAEREVGGDARNLLAALEVNELGIGGKGIADGVAAITNTTQTLQFAWFRPFIEITLFT